MEGPGPSGAAGKRRSGITSPASAREGLRPPFFVAHCCLVRRSSSGSLAMLAAMRRASSLDDRTRLEFIFFKEHDSREFGGVPMPLTGAIPEGRSFFCPHCGALYALTYSRLSTSDSNIARCVVCGQIMDKWDLTKVPIFKLIHRPEDY